MMRRLTAFFALPLIAGPVLAEDVRMDIVVTAARTAPPSPSANVLGGAALSRHASEDLTDSLARVAGVRAFRKGGLGGSAYVALRGGEPNFTAVLIEGALVTDPTNTQGGGFDFAQLAPSVVERMTIVPGALSAVQGAEALSGAVDIRLKRPTESVSAAGQGRIDTDGGIAFDLSAGLPIGDGGLLIGGSHADRESEAQQSLRRRTQALARFSQNVGGVAFGLTALHSDFRRTGFPEDSGGVLLAANREQERREGNFTLIAADIVRSEGALRPELRFSWSRTAADVATPAIFPGTFDAVPAITSDTVFQRYQVDAGINWDAVEALRFALGGSFVREAGENVGTLDIDFPLPTAFDISRERVGAYLEGTFAPVPSVSLTASVRLDDPEELSPEWTVRTSGRWRVAENGPTLFASYGEGYRLPSLFALAFPLIANPDLRPERSRSWEAGVSQKVGSGTVTLSLFDTRYTDLIDFEPALFTNVNRARVDTRGAEARGDLTLGAWRLGASLSYLDIDVAEGQSQLRSRPEWQGSLGVSREWDNGLAASLTLLGVADSFDASIPTGLVELDGFVTIDAALTVPLHKGVALRLDARNLLDEDYQESVGVPALGITGSAGIVFGF
ncbi:TonB-dependent receptor [Pacificimonas sp. WHA3]|uniref:TonB-dependent receptor n=1 Tax=Pacificimonas pallii TaxID=2827236 RepID=A0ABS6SDE9_9SPHN|nr:TonB-dependent receptor [Pacificimonas pallii]MBV7256449.1 TonB-dependent receptor [Pacificimonas pallii]